jgi:hypothetical protein
MTNQHPITPPPELVEKWYDAIPGSSTDWRQQLAIKAAQWGAAQELEACCGALDELNDGFWSEKLRAARRPKPPSLKEQALEAWEIANQSWTTISDKEVAIIIRRALEALPND